MSFFSFSINDLLCQDQVDLKEEEEKAEVRSENRDAKGVVCWLGSSFFIPNNAGHRAQLYFHDRATVKINFANCDVFALL